jgi:hypothetical protein
VAWHALEFALEHSLSSRVNSCFISRSGRRAQRPRPSGLERARAAATRRPLHRHAGERSRGPSHRLPRLILHGATACATHSIAPLREKKLCPRAPSLHPPSESGRRRHRRRPRCSSTLAAPSPRWTSSTSPAGGSDGKDPEVAHAESSSQTRPPRRSCGGDVRRSFERGDGRVTLAHDAGRRELRPAPVGRPGCLPHRQVGAQGGGRRQDGKARIFAGSKSRVKPEREGQIQN